MRNKPQLNIVTMGASSSIFFDLRNQLSSGNLINEYLVKRPNNLSIQNLKELNADLDKISKAIDTEIPTICLYLWNGMAKKYTEEDGKLEDAKTLANTTSKWLSNNGIATYLFSTIKLYNPSGNLISSNSQTTETNKYTQIKKGVEQTFTKEMDKGLYILRLPGIIAINSYSSLFSRIYNSKAETIKANLQSQEEWKTNMFTDTSALARLIRHNTLIEEVIPQNRPVPIGSSEYLHISDIKKHYPNVRIIDNRNTVPTNITTGWLDEKFNDLINSRIRMLA